MENKNHLLLQRIEDYNPEKIRNFIEKSLNLIFDSNKDYSSFTVLVKPNLLSPAHPDKCITTHPVVVEETCKALKKRVRKVLLGDAQPVNKDTYKVLWTKTGMQQVAANSGAELVVFEKYPVKNIFFANTILPISSIIDNVDMIISLPKFKTHTLTILTGAVKNLYGFVPGYSKARFHKILPKVDDFSKLLVTILKHIPLSLSIVDGIRGMDGNGPSNGNPFNTNFMIAGTNPVEIDAVLANIADVNPSKIHYLLEANKEGLGNLDINAITISDNNVNQFKNKDFKLPDTTKARFIPNFIVRILGRFFWIKPKFNDKCIGCRECIKKCPTNALTFGDNKPMLNKDKCIECLCCQETCREGAIDMNFSLLARIIIRK